MAPWSLSNQLSVKHDVGRLEVGSMRVGLDDTSFLDCTKAFRGKVDTQDCEKTVVLDDTTTLLAIDDVPQNWWYFVVRAAVAIRA